MNVEEDRRGLKVLRVFEGALPKGGIQRGDLIAEVDASR